MAVSVSTWSIRNPIPPILLFVLLTVAGVVGFIEMPITNMPNVAMPVVMVVVNQPGAVPSEMEAQVTNRIEGALATIQGVKHIISTVSEGVSSTRVEFSLESDIDRAVNDTRTAVAAIRGELPAAAEEPQVQRQQETGGAILIYTVEAPEMSVEELSVFVDETLSRELLSVGGVARVDRSGGVPLELTVTVDPARLSALGITAADVSRQLAATNVDVPGGRMTVQGTEYSLRTVGGADTLDRLRDLRIALPNGRQARLGDLGTIARGGAELRTINRVDGRPAVTLSVFRTPTASEISVGKKVEARLAEIAQKRNLEFHRVFSLVSISEKGYRSTMSTLVEGVLLTLVVVFLFLRDRRATVITALAIPLSIIPTFVVMRWLDFTLNLTSLSAVSLVTGVLVDDAIVEIENIHRYMRAGKGPLAAAIEAAEEIGLPVIATTLVICAVFVPVSIMGGLPGLYFRQFGLTVAVAALFSLIVARLLTPMLASRLLKPVPPEEETEGVAMRAYQRLVSWTLRHRLATLGLAVVTMVGSVALIPLLPTAFMPFQDFSLAAVRIELPQGSTLEETDARAQQVAAMLKSRPEVTQVLTTTGEELGGVNRARVMAMLVPPKERSLDARQFGNEVLPRITALPDTRAVFDNNVGRKDISIALVSEDPESLSRSVEAIERELRGVPGLASVGTSAGQKQPEVVVVVDPVKAARLGITTWQIGEAVNVSTLGDGSARLARFNDVSRMIPIRVRLPPVGQNLGALENLMLRTPSGASVPLSAVASIRFGAGPTTIERYDRRRRINVEANLNGIALGTALERIYALPSVKALPKTVQVLNTRDAEFMAELMASFLKALGAGLLMVYSIQVLLYKDWLQPLTRMAAVPLSIGGAFLLLFLTRSEFGLPAMIGIIMLMGISDKNSILLVDYILERMREGVPRTEAILSACRVRARPIIMTSLAMTAGMLPPALGFGLDASFRKPMALAVIGGLVSSTVLSLVFMPVLFSYVRDFEEWIARRREGGRKASVHVLSSAPREPDVPLAPTAEERK